MNKLKYNWEQAWIKFREIPQNQRELIGWTFWMAGTLSLAIPLIIVGFFV